MPRGNAQVVRHTIGPGTLYAAPIGTGEPAATVPFPAWPTGWFPLGYTQEGSSFSYELNSEPVEVAEELDNLFNITVGRTSSLGFALAEITQFNLRMMLNGGVSAIADPATGAAVVFEPPDLGTEVRIMLAHQAESNLERWIFRQCFQTGSLEINRRKGADKPTLPGTFSLEVPDTGKRIFARHTTTALKGGPGTV